MRHDIEQLFKDFLYESEFVKKSRPGTLMGYQRVFELFRKLLPDQDMEDINEATIARFFNILQTRRRIVGNGSVRSGIKKSTVASYYRKLNVFFAWLERRRYIKANPFKGVHCPKPNYDDKKYLKREEIERIISAIMVASGNNLLVYKRNVAIINLLLFCGFRRSELLNLQLRDVDFENKMITVRAETCKSDRLRVIPMHSQVILCLKDYLKERQKYTTPYLIVSRNYDGKLGNHGLKHLFVKISESSGIKFHTHQFRHTFAVNFLKSSNNLAKLKQLLGHTDISMTAQYLRCLPILEFRKDIEHMSVDRLI